MNSDQWQRIKEIYQSAVDLPADERTSFIALACAGDGSLREEVESLLVSHQSAADFIENPVFEAGAKLLIDERKELLQGRRIGPYRIIREIGRGGMGAVYLAERDDEHYRQHVAIKLIKRGMDTDAILHRFRNERQILATLEHPNIARLLDGGSTETGLPYLVMEYIEGTPIDEFCIAHQLSIPERLDLFRTVCSAVQYAHQNLIIHRDIKPGNILITSDGIPKLLDFGVAKVLSPDLSQESGATSPGMLMMTPEYASPEQALGKPVATTTDVYSLGVVLYELLTGQQPHALKEKLPHEIAQHITDREPEKPSSAISKLDQVSNQRLRHQLKGDLDTIILRALQSDPRQRYGSIEQFSEDIHRHLTGLPIMAREDSIIYRADRFIRRNWKGTAAAFLLFVVLLSGIIATSIQAQIARAQRARAEKEFNNVRKLADSFMFEFHDAIANLPGSTPARELVVRRAVEYLDGLAQEAGDDPSLQMELAAAYEKLGRIQGTHLLPSLGDSNGAIKSFQKSLMIREALLRASPENLDYVKALCDSYWYIADALVYRGEMSRALDYFRKGLDLKNKVQATAPGNPEYRFSQAGFNTAIGSVLLAMGDIQGALERQQKAMEIRQSLFDAMPADPRARRALAISHEYMGVLFDRMNNSATALEQQEKALTLRNELALSDPANTDIALMVYYSHFDLGGLLLEMNDSSAAMAHYQKALAIIEPLLKADPRSMEYRVDDASTRTGIGDVLAKNGSPKKALELYRNALATRLDLVAIDPMNVMHRSNLAETYVKAGRVMDDMGESDEALTNYQEGTEIYKTLSDSIPESAAVRGALADSFSTLGDHYVRRASGRSITAGTQLDNWQEARVWYSRSAEIWQSLRDHGTLVPAYSQKPGIVSSAIQKCDEALSKR